MCQSTCESSGQGVCRGNCVNGQCPQTTTTTTRITSTSTTTTGQQNCQDECSRVWGYGGSCKSGCSSSTEIDIGQFSCPSGQKCCCNKSPITTSTTTTSTVVCPSPDGCCCCKDCSLKTDCVWSYYASCQSGGRQDCSRSSCSITCPADKPSPDWGVKNGKCLPSCGYIGGPNAKCQSDQCKSDEKDYVDNYQCDHCCVPGIPAKCGNGVVDSGEKCDTGKSGYCEGCQFRCAPYDTKDVCKADCSGYCSGYADTGCSYQDSGICVKDPCGSDDKCAGKRLGDVCDASAGGICSACICSAGKSCQELCNNAPGSKCAWYSCPSGTTSQPLGDNSCSQSGTGNRCCCGQTTTTTTASPICCNRAGIVCSSCTTRDCSSLYCPTTTTTSTSTNPNGPSGQINFDKNEYQIGDTATITWNWSNAVTNQYNENAVMEILGPPDAYGNIYHGTFLATSTSGSSSTSIKIDIPGEWKAVLSICQQSDCSLICHQWPCNPSTAKKDVSTFTATATANAQQTAQCKQVYYSGDPSNKFNLVFIGLGNWSGDDIVQIAKAHADNWFSLDPISANRNKVNIYAVVDNYLTLNDCQLSQQNGGFFTCDVQKVMQLATNCPMSVGGVGVVQSGFTVFRSVCAGQYFTTERNNPIVSSHELGHCFAALADEYCYDYDFTNNVCKSGAASSFENSPNCDLTNNCPKWASYDPNCVQECSWGNLYRPQDCSLMRDLRCFYFDEPSKRAIIDRFNQFSDPAFANIKTNLIFMNLHYDNGKISVKDIESGTGYTPSFQGTGGFNLSEISNQNSVLYSTNFQIPDKIYSDNLDTNGNITNGSTIEQKQFDFSVVVPSFTDSKEMNIYTPDNVKVQTLDVSNLAYKGLVVTSNSCHPNSECEIDLIGCSDNLNIFVNKDNKPISSTILVDDKNQTTFSPVESGTIRMISFCFDNQIRVLTSDITVS
jgi:hypothetical protein